MGNYNSENSEVLMMHTEEGGFRPNTRMLLLHRCNDGRLQYIIGSFFTATFYDGALGYERYDYSWVWGHYFDGPDALLVAVHYWEREVLGIGDEVEEGAAL